MTGAGAIGAIEGRIAAIESRIGVGTRGADVRAERAFADLLARHTTASGGSTSGIASASPTGAAGGVASGLLERLAAGLGTGATPAASPGATGALAGVPFADLFQRAGAAHGVDPALLAAVADAESGFDPTAVSHAGARGLMQLMPATARGLGVTDAFDPAQAVDGAARLLAGHLDRFGSVELALAAYNAGPGAVTRHGGIPPYAETQAYVPKVLARYQELR